MKQRVWQQVLQLRFGHSLGKRVAYTRDINLYKYIYVFAYTNKGLFNNKTRERYDPLVFI